MCRTVGSSLKLKTGSNRSMRNDWLVIYYFLLFIIFFFIGKLMALGHMHGVETTQIPFDLERKLMMSMTKWTESISFPYWRISELIFIEYIRSTKERISPPSLHLKYTRHSQLSIEKSKMFPTQQQYRQFKIDGN